MALKLLGKKVGMTCVFDKEGKKIPCTLIKIEKNQVVQIKSKETDGYTALQVGAAYKKKKNIKKPLLKRFEKLNLEPNAKLFECRVDDIDKYKIGDEIDLDYLKDIKFIDVEGISKGKGYQGVIKKYGFGGGRASHGSGFHRRAGSTGMRSTPGRCLPGGKRASRMGGKKISVQNLKIVEFLKEDMVLAVKGAIPGFCSGFVYIKKSIKKYN